MSQFPKDYLWMFSATLLILAYVILMASIHAYATKQTKIFSQIGLSFAIVTAVILLSDYFIQFSVIPVSLINGETEGITLLTQYNSHGIFIALEELGYLVMSLSFLFMAPIFANKDRLESAIRWVFTIGFILTIIALATISINYGLDRKDRFEVFAISINWFALIINGVLLSIVFSRQRKETSLQDLSHQERIALFLERTLDRRLGRFGIALYRLTGGRIGRWFGKDVLILATQGRRSGQERAVLLQFFHDGAQIVVVAANGGHSSHPGWFYNLKATPTARVQVMDRNLQVRAEELSADEVTAFWPRILQRSPDYARYRKSTRRTIPLIRLIPVARSEEE